MSTLPIPDTLTSHSTICECRHCGLPVPKERQHGQYAFCCSGCEYIYRTISSLGLDDFYKYRETARVSGRKAASPRGGDYLQLDSKRFHEALVRPRIDGLFEVTLTLDGIHCAGCVWLLDRLPTLLPGIKESSLQFSSGRILIIFDSALKLSSIASMLDSLGYPPRLENSKSNAQGDRETRRMLFRIGVAAFSSMNAMVLAVSLWEGFYTHIEQEYGALFRWGSLVLSLPAITYSAYPFYRTAWLAIRARTIHIDLPISIGLIGGFILSVWNTLMDRPFVYFDSVATLTLLLLVGRYLQARAMMKARSESNVAWSIIPTFARAKRGEDWTLIATEMLQEGDIIQVGAGERIAADGTIQSGESSLDTAVLTGESAPVPVNKGGAALAGALNIEAPIIVEVTRVGEFTRIGKILASLHDGKNISPLLSLTDRVSGIFVLVILFGAVATFLYWYFKTGIFDAVDTAVALLIVTCPCALGLATPAALTVALGRAGKQGILIRGGDTIERLAGLKKLFLDKTGTLTEGKQKVVNTKLHKNLVEADVRALVSALGQIANHHPASKALVEWAGLVDSVILESPRYKAGRGVEGIYKGSILRLGSPRWIFGEVTHASSSSLDISKENDQGLSVVVLEREGVVLAEFQLLDLPLEDAKRSLAILRSMGITLSIVSGDSPGVVEKVGSLVGIPSDECHGSQYPEDKARWITQSSIRSGMVGDGVNDALAMKEADVAIAVRGGVQALLEVVDIYIPTRGILGVAEAVKGAKRTMTVVKYNLVISAIYNILGAAGAICGYITPITAAILMPVSSFTVIGYSLWASTFTAEKKT